MFNIKYKHYIRINENNKIIYAFSDAFEQPLETDILIGETEERHCQFQVFSEKYFTKYKYKYINGQIIEKTEDELYTAEEKKSDKVKAIKAEAERRILEKYPLWKQIDLISKMHNNKDTEGKKNDMKEYINNIRDISDSLEEQVNNYNTKEDINTINIEF